MVRGATPDVVLTAVELLAHGLDAEHPVPATSWSSTSAARPPTCTRWSRLDPEDAGLAREVVATTPVTRTVEGDLGMRWSAVPHRRGGPCAGLLDDPDRLRAAADVRRADPAFLPGRRRGRRR